MTLICHINTGNDYSYMSKFTTDSSIVLLHVFTWLITLAAMFFILLGEAHYSIDVLIAFFLSALYFNYYHTLVNHHNPQNESSLHTPPSSWLRRLCFVRQRLRIWVPFYSYLERGTGGAPLPHEFESPLTALLRFVRGVRHRVKFGKSRLIWCVCSCLVKFCKTKNYC